MEIESLIILILANYEVRTNMSYSEGFKWFAGHNFRDITQWKQWKFNNVKALLGYRCHITFHVKLFVIFSYYVWSLTQMKFMHQFYKCQEHPGNVYPRFITCYSFRSSQRSLILLL